MPVDLGPIMNHAPAWLMVLFRLTGIFILAPMLGSQTIPRQVKVFLVVGLSFCVYPMLLDPQRASAGYVGSIIDQGLPLWTLIGQVGAELLIGFAIGFMASLPIIGMQIGGQIIDQQMGMGFAGMVNPELNETAGIIARLLFMLALTLFIILGGHRIMFVTLIGSFEKIPLGVLGDVQGLLDMVVGLLGVTFEMAFRIAAPMLCVMFLIQLAMGFIMRTVPQINILTVGFSIRIMLGALFLIVFVTVAANVYLDTMHDVMDMILRFFTV